MVLQARAGDRSAFDRRPHRACAVVHLGQALARRPARASEHRGRDGGYGSAPLDGERPPERQGDAHRAPRSWPDPRRPGTGARTVAIALDHRETVAGAFARPRTHRPVRTAFSPRASRDDSGAARDERGRCWPGGPVWLLHVGEGCAGWQERHTLRRSQPAIHLDQSTVPRTTFSSTAVKKSIGASPSLLRKIVAVGMTRFVTASNASA